MNSPSELRFKALRASDRESPELIGRYLDELHEIVKLPPDEWTARAHIELAIYFRDLAHWERCAEQCREALRCNPSVPVTSRALEVLSRARCNQGLQLTISVDELVAAARECEAEYVDEAIDGYVIAAWELLPQRTADGRKLMERIIELVHRVYGERSLRASIEWRAFAQFELTAGNFDVAEQYVARSALAVPEQLGARAFIEQRERARLLDKIQAARGDVHARYSKAAKDD